MTEQLSFLTPKERLTIGDRKINLIELFAGVGAQAKALERLVGADGFTKSFVCDFDKYQIQGYNAIHGDSLETSDITKIHAKDIGVKPGYFNILTYSFPCQDLSLAGHQNGAERGSGTRSSLLFEVERILLECRVTDGRMPEMLLMENVPQLVGAKNRHAFDDFIGSLKSIGYNSVWKIMNAKDYGIPQNRKRIFCVSFLGDYEYTFPEEIPLNLRLKHMLEDDVDEKYYLSDETVEKLVKTMKEQKENPM